MIIACPHCSLQIEYSDRAPSFCHECGHVLPKSEQANVADAATEIPDTQPFIHGSSAKPVIDGYRLDRQLGRGGMGIVWEAIHEESGRRVALKVLSGNLTRDEEHVDRFLREARLAASLSHPRSTFVFGAGQHDGSPYIIMELMPGQTLQDVVERDNPLPVEVAIDYILDVIDGLEAAHRHGVIHRDVKPSNCFIDGDGRAKVGDFGLSKSLVGDVHVTRTGAFVGTPMYAAPEQVRGGSVDERTDIYAVGATLFYLLTGQGPYAGDAVSVIAQIASEPPRKITDLRPEVPRTLETIVAKTLEKQPEKRFRNLSDLRRALLPFSSQGTGIADVWRRLGAYVVDNAVCMLVMSAVVIGMNILLLTLSLTGWVTSETISRLSRQFNNGSLLLSALQILILAGYFAVLESRWGCGLGKWMMGLRLVDSQGESPSFWRAAWRSWFIPAALGLPLLSALVTPDAEAVEAGDQAVTIELILLAIASTLPGQVFQLLCISSMRKSNGYRGWHDFASGCRVVRVGPGIFRVRRTEIPVIAPADTDWKGRRLGPFTVTGFMHTTEQGVVLEGRDDMLNRTVWIRVGEPGSDRSVSAGKVQRATRPHWLQSGQLADRHWEAFEAVQGAPIERVLPELGNKAWSRSAHWLADLANELAISSEEGTLPDRLDADHVWIERSGQIKLLDDAIAPLAASQTESSRAQTESSERNAQTNRTAEGLLLHLLRRCTSKQIVSTRVGELLESLDGPSGSGSTLKHVADELSEIEARPQSITWDYRLATLFASAMVELNLYFLVVMVPAFVIAGLFGSRSIWLGMLGFIVGVICCLIMGGGFRGGPVFHFMRVEVQDRRGEQASRLRCALRNLVAWCLLLLADGMVTSVAVYAVVGDGGVAGVNLSDSGQGLNVSLNSDAPRIVTIISIGVAVPLFMLFFGGALFAAISARRGIQDLLVGTRLAPRL